MKFHSYQLKDDDKVTHYVDLFIKSPQNLCGICFVKPRDPCKIQWPFRLFYKNVLQFDYDTNKCCYCIILKNEFSDTHSYAYLIFCDEDLIRLYFNKQMEIDLYAQIYNDKMWCCVNSLKNMVVLPILNQVRYGEHIKYKYENKYYHLLCRLLTFVLKNCYTFSPFYQLAVVDTMITFWFRFKKDQMTMELFGPLILYQIKLVLRIWGRNIVDSFGNNVDCCLWRDNVLLFVHLNMGGQYPLLDALNKCFWLASIKNWDRLAFICAKLIHLIRECVFFIVVCNFDCDLFV